MRYSRLKRSRSRRRYFLMFVVGLLIFGGVYFLSAGAVGRYISGIIGPILAKDKASEKADEDGVGLNQQISQNDREEVEFILPQSEDENNAVNEKDDSRAGDSRTTESIKIEPMNYYAIQVGAFNGIDNAELLSREIKQRGGAGYIIEDEYFRVMAMAYATDEDAQQVRNQLKEQEVESQIYRITCPGINMEITATKDKIEGIKSSFSVWNEKASLLENIIRDLDTNKTTGEISLNKLSEVRKELEAQLEKIREYIAANEGNKILEGLRDLYQSQITNIDQILQRNGADRVAISSDMKYNYIDMIYQFKKYIEEITRG